MLKILFKNLLASHYSFAKRWSNKKIKETVINGTVHTFLLQFTFLIAGFCCIILGTISYKFKYPEIFLIAIALLIGYGFMRSTKNAIIKWDIERDYKALTRNQRRNRNISAFLVFWSCFAIFLYFAITFLSGYSLK